MRLTAPAGLAALALAAPLTLWYLLRSRRPRVEVGSTYLWARTQRSVSAAVPWQRFRPDRTFWLVLAAIILGAVALARPVVPVEAPLGAHTIVIVDASASMSADEGGPTRLELARRRAAELADRLGPGQVLSVVEAGPRARTLASAAGDAAEVRRALARLRPSHGRADLVDAFTLAGALQRPGQHTVFQLLTDGELPAEAAPAAPADLLVEAVGEARANLSLARLQAVATGAGGAEALVQVRSWGAVETDARVLLEADGIVVVERQITLPPRATEDLVLAVPVDAAEGVVLRAAVEPVGPDRTGAAATDALSVDDQAWTVLAGASGMRVLVAGPGNVFLESAFAAVAGVEVDTAPGIPDDLAGVDLLVVDRIPAPSDVRLPTLYVAPTTPPAGVDVTGELELPAVTSVAADHELLRDADLSELAVAAAQQVSAPELAAIVDGPSGPLLLAGRLDGQPVAYLAFDLLQSNLPLQVAWPVLAANTTSWLAGPPVTGPLVAGTEATVPVPAGVTGVTVSPPTGAAMAVDPARPRVLVDQVGLWRVAYDGPADVVDAAAHVVLPVNAPVDEGDLMRPRPASRRAGDEDAERPAGVTAGVEQGFRSLVPVFLGLVLALLVVEWVATHLPGGWRGGRRRRRRRTGLRGGRRGSRGTPAHSLPGGGSRGTPANSRPPAGEGRT